MNKLIFIILFGIYPATIFSQISESSYTLGEPYEKVNSSDFYVTFKNNLSIILKSKGNKISIQKFDVNTLKEISRNEIEAFPERCSFIKFYEFNTKVFFIYSYLDKNENYHLWLKEIDLEKDSISPDYKNVAKTIGSDIAPVFGGERGNNFIYTYFRPEFSDDIDIKVSSDSSKLLIAYRHESKTVLASQNYDIYGFCVFDENLNIIWSNEVQMPFNQKKLTLLSITLSNEGNVLLLSSLIKDKSSKVEKGNLPNYYLQISEYSKDRSPIRTLDLDVKNKFINSGRLILKEDNIFCTGYYTVRDVRTEVKGTYSMTLDYNGKVKSSTFSKFPLEFVTRHESKSTVNFNKSNYSRGKAYLPDLALKEIIFIDDSSYLIVGEQLNLFVETMSGNDRFYFNDIIISKINYSGTVLWNKKIPKYQTGHSFPGGLSYKHVKSSNTHLFTFLGNIKNLELPIDEPAAIHMDEMGGYLLNYAINEQDGSVKKYSILDSRDLKGKVLTNFSIHKVVSIRPNQYILEMDIDKKESLLIKVKLEQ